MLTTRDRIEEEPGEDQKFAPCCAMWITGMYPGGLSRVSQETRMKSADPQVQRMDLWPGH